MMTGGINMTLFKKDMEPSCLYCENGVQVTEELIMCEKWGMMDITESCRHFEYDPLKRVPARPKKIAVGNLKAEDFKL